MSNELAKLFEFGGMPVRTVVTAAGEVWFVGKDVCEILGISKYRDAIARLDDDERVSSSSGHPWAEKGVATTDTLGGPQAMAMINEPGLYRLIFESRKPEAGTFKRWVFHDVLPSIRKTGSYTLPENAGIVDAIMAALPVERAEQLTELSRDSDQTLNGFPFHDDRFMTAKEIAEHYGLDEACVWRELHYRGWIETKDQYRGLGHDRGVERLSDVGRNHGEEILNRRKGRKSARQPFSFRWRHESVPVLMALYVPLSRRSGGVRP